MTMDADVRRFQEFHAPLAEDLRLLLIKHLKGGLNPTEFEKILVSFAAATAQQRGCEVEPFVAMTRDSYAFGAVWRELMSRRREAPVQ